jgi:hypothetical protein
MRRHCINAATLTLLIASGGCGVVGSPDSPQVVHPGEKGGVVNEQIQVGMERAKVVALVGPPQRTETHGATEFLFYTLPWPMTPFSYNPVAVANGKVTGTGMSYYESIQKSANVPPRRP